MTLTDYDEIVHTIQLYIDGFNKHDPSKFREAFDEDAWIFYFGAHRNGELKKAALVHETFEDGLTNKWRFY